MREKSLHLRKREINFYHEVFIMEDVRLWPENSLPVPYGLSTQEAVEVEDVQIIEDDNFSKGKIIKYFPNQGYGFIEDRGGREIVFHLGEVEVLGKRNVETIKSGMVVGYDLARAGSKEHVKKMKLY